MEYSSAYFNGHRRNGRQCGRRRCHAVCHGRDLTALNPEIVKVRVLEQISNTSTSASTIEFLAKSHSKADRGSIGKSVGTLEYLGRRRNTSASTVFRYECAMESSCAMGDGNTNTVLSRPFAHDHGIASLDCHSKCMYVWTTSNGPWPKSKKNGGVSLRGKPRRNFKHRFVLYVVQHYAPHAKTLPDQ